MLRESTGERRSLSSGRGKPGRRRLSGACRREFEDHVGYLEALALQIGSEVNNNELSKITGLNKGTVANYIDILEKGYIAFRLNSFSRNLRNEIKRTRRTYFYDNGVRNALVAIITRALESSPRPLGLGRTGQQT
ncbi:hypothetical protein GF420_13155 [candidate division GN15 bacterium]|nr:hypothetical protein [candidate division GN15 bacterium]